MPLSHPPRAYLKTAPALGPHCSTALEQVDNIANYNLPRKSKTSAQSACREGPSSPLSIANIFSIEDDHSYLYRTSSIYKSPLFLQSTGGLHGSTQALLGSRHRPLDPRNLPIPGRRVQLWEWVLDLPSAGDMSQVTRVLAQHRLCVDVEVTSAASSSIYVGRMSRAIFQDPCEGQYVYRCWWQIQYVLGFDIRELGYPFDSFQIWDQNRFTCRFWTRILSVLIAFVVLPSLFAALSITRVLVR